VHKLPRGGQLRVVLVRGYGCKLSTDGARDAQEHCVRGSVGIGRVGAYHRREQRRLRTDAFLSTRPELKTNTTLDAVGWMYSS
jgi:hypothetical protein